MFSKYNQMVKDNTPGSLEGENAMTAYVNELYLNGDLGEDGIFWEDGSGQVRYGKRVLYWDSQGFIYLFKFSTVQQAEKDSAEMLDK